VASVKPNTSGSTSSGSSSNGNGHFRGTNLTAKSLILQGYRVQDFQVVGGPDWLNTERFDVEARAADGSMPIYSLVVARSPAPGNNGIQMSGSGIYMSGLARMLGGQVRRIVNDNTNLEGQFDYTLTWSGSSSPNLALSPAGGDVPTATEPAGPSIFTAIQEQLGLRLESTRGPVEVIVIDSVQKPTEN
jgi:hypothetical protein